MIEKLKEIVKNIIEDEESTKEFGKLKTMKEVYEKCKELGYESNYEEFEKDYNQIVYGSSREISLKELEGVSGGIMNRKLTKATAAILSALTLSTTAIPQSSAAEYNGSASKSSSSMINFIKENPGKSLLIALGATATVVGGGVVVGAIIAKHVHDKNKNTVIQDQVDLKSESEYENKSKSKSRNKSENKSKSKSRNKSENKPKSKSKNKSESKPKIKSENKSESNPKVKSENKSESKHEESSKEREYRLDLYNLVEKNFVLGSDDYPYPKSADDVYNQLKTLDDIIRNSSAKSISYLTYNYLDYNVFYRVLFNYIYKASAQGGTDIKLIIDGIKKWVEEKKSDKSFDPEYIGEFINFMIRIENKDDLNQFLSEVAEREKSMLDDENTNMDYYGLRINVLGDKYGTKVEKNKVNEIFEEFKNSTIGMKGISADGETIQYLSNKAFRFLVDGAENNEYDIVIPIKNDYVRRIANLSLPEDKGWSKKYRLNKPGGNSYFINKKLGLILETTYTFNVCNLYPLESIRKYFEEYSDKFKNRNKEFMQALDIEV